jgi:hypothetical protein
MVVLSDGWMDEALEHREEQSYYYAAKVGQLGSRVSDHEE